MLDWRSGEKGVWFIKMAKGMWNRLGMLLMVCALVFAGMPEGMVTAAEKLWTAVGDGSFVLNGTDVKVRISGDTIYVSGNGAIPDYDERTLVHRPWHKAECKYLILDNTITSVGRYAFASLSNLQKVTLSSTTFIADKSSFAGIAYAPVFRILGYSETVTQVGSISYSSLDSIKAFAQNRSDSANFLMDQFYMVPLFQNSTNPTIANVYCAYDDTTPWEAKDEDYNGNRYTAFCELLSGSAEGCFTLRAEKIYADKAVYEVFASAIGEDTFAFTFTMELRKNDLVSVTRTLTPMIYCITLPDEWVEAGRTFRIISTGQGTVEILEDLDADDKTVTFMTSVPQAVFGVVYR